MLLRMDNSILQKNRFKGEKHKSVGVYDPIHKYLKSTSQFYDIGMNNLVNNILLAWLEEHKDEIKADQAKRFASGDLFGENSIWEEAIFVLIRNNIIDFRFLPQQKAVLGVMIIDY